MLHRRLIVPTALLAIALAACGSSAGTSATPTTARPTSTTGTGPPITARDPAPHAGGGWIDGEPDWGSVSAETGGAMPMTGSGDDAAMPPVYAEEAVDVPGDVAAGDVAPYEGQVTPLRAGSVDDNADFAGFLEYLERYEELGMPARPYDPTGRIVATVTGANGLPVAGTPVTVSANGATVAELRTSADGQVIFLPAEHGDVQPAYTFAAGGVSVDAAPDTAAALTLPTDGGAEAGMPVDVLFLLDVTGSMGDEIAQLKATIAQVSDQLQALPQQPDIRFGMTLFRDEGDLFVTSTFDFTNDIESFQAALDQVEADGGGDTPEAVDEAFAAALGDPSWRDPASTVQLVFLVGDAAPQIGRQVPTTYPQSIQEAASRGITVHVVAASQTDDPAEHTFREIAQGTGGRFVFLAYGAAGTATGEHTDIASTDYEELSLDQLVVRLVGEELAALTGEAFTPPPTPSTVPSTDPQGQ
jgi:hypothetical protein